MAKLIQLGRLTLDLGDQDFQRVVAGLKVWPIDLSVARQSTQLDFQGDPADELIAATSVVHQLPLVTRDRNILTSQLVPFP